MKVIEKLWMLANDQGLIYCVGISAKDVWQRVIEDEVMGTGVTREMLKKRGYKAKQVAICEL